MRGAFLIYQSSAVRPTPSGAEGAYSRTPVTIDLRFRPCLCRFFPKGTVACAICLAISTVPLTIFCKRHGRPCHLPRISDHASAIVPQKARHSLSWGGVQFAKKEADPCGSASVICHYGRWPCRPPSTSGIRGIAGCDCNLAPSAAYRKMIASRSGPTET